MDTKTKKAGRKEDRTQLAREARTAGVDLSLDYMDKPVSAGDYAPDGPMAQLHKEMGLDPSKT